MMHFWTGVLRNKYNDKDQSSLDDIKYWCQVIPSNIPGEYTDNTKTFPCVMVVITTSCFTIYFVFMILQYIITYFFLLRLAKCPTCCSKVTDEDDDLLDVN